MKVSFNFDTGARRIRLRAEDPLEEIVLGEMALLCTKGVNMKITRTTENKSMVRSPISAESNIPVLGDYEIEMRINGFEKEKKSE